MFHRLALLTILAVPLTAVSAAAQATDVRIGAHGALAPATYLGRADGSDYHLDLWDNQAFHLTIQPDDGSGLLAHAGRWFADGETGSIVLPLSDGEISLEVRNSERLRIPGSPEDGSADLVTDGSLAPAEMSLPIAGMFTYYADAATILHCATGLSYPVASEVDYLDLERAYLENRAGSGESLFVTLDGTIATRPQMEGAPRPTVVVDEFRRTWPGEDCSRTEGVPGLAGVYWRILSLGETDLRELEGSREPFLVFRAGEERFNASVGCNSKFGGFTEVNGAITMPQVASTMMACPDERLARLDALLGETLQSTDSYAIGGKTLLLLDVSGSILARLEAAYLP